MGTSKIVAATVDPVPVGWEHWFCKICKAAGLPAWEPDAYKAREARKNKPHVVQGGFYCEDCDFTAQCEYAADAHERGEKHECTVKCFVKL